jgi:PE-PPE domain
MRGVARSVVRSAAVALLVIVAAVLLALTSTMASVFTLVAATTFVIPGTNYAKPFCQPFCGTLVTPQQNIDLAQIYVPSSLFVNPSYVNYPRSFWPLSVGYFDATKFDDAVKQGVAALPSPATVPSGSVIFGYSQGADVATIYKRNFNQYWASNPAGAPAISFVLIGNGNRPNGGALQRFHGLFIPIVEMSYNGSTPTNTVGTANAGKITTIDVAQQYDGFADFPNNPLNVLADANALAGLFLVHLNYQGVNPNQAVFQSTYGDTAYYLIPTYPLPLLMPLMDVPVAGPILADMLDPTLRVLVESAYNREINPGQPTLANIFYFPNPVTFGAALIASVPTGLAIGIEDIIGARTPGTPPAYVQGQGTYGLFGPPVTLEGQTPIPYQSAIGSPQPTPTPTPDSTSTTTPSPLGSAAGLLSSSLLGGTSGVNLSSLLGGTSGLNLSSLLGGTSGLNLSSLLGGASGLGQLFSPTTFASEFAQFSQLTSILNGGQPVNIASLFSTSPGTTGLASLFDPMTALTQVVKAAAQNLPASTPSPNHPPAILTHTLSDQPQSAPPVEAAASLSTTSHAWQHTDAQNGSGTLFSGIRSGTDTPTGDTPSTTPPVKTAAANTSASDQTPAPNRPSSGPRLNVCLQGPCGGSFTQSGTTTPSTGTSTGTSTGNGTGTAISSAINGVASAIGGAVSNTVNAISGALGQHPAGGGTTSSTSHGG